jgi:threonine/homoserine/homoserine lactone efflux protein
VTVLTALLSFILVAGPLTLVPGLDTALVVRVALTRGRRHAFATAVGIGTGTLFWGAAAAAGLTVILTASHVAYTTLRIAGAIYLIWYGGSTLFALWRSRGTTQSTAELSATSATPEGGLTRAWARGTLTNLLNPKVGITYVALLPQFIPAGVPHLPMGLALAAVHDTLGMLWFSLLIFGAHVARGILGRPSVKRAMEAITASVLLAFGIRLATGE